MGSKHEQIQETVLQSWSVDKRGRLFNCRQGLATPFRGEFPIWFGPLTPKFKGHPDLYGWEIINGLPIFCFIEVKTLAYSKLSDGQKTFMSYAKSIGCRCYIAMESRVEGELYFLKEFEG